LNKRNLKELTSLNNPPGDCFRVMEIFLTCLGYKKFSWGEAKSLKMDELIN
jgi:hypothetical protein